jgi:integrase/recombinase XerC
MTTKDAVTQFLKDLTNEGRSPHTVAAYRRDLAAFTSFTGNILIDAIIPATLTAFMADQTVQFRPCGNPKGKATINRYRVSLKALFAWCEARWLVPRNPTAILKCKRHRSLPPEVLTEDEITRLLGFSFQGKWADRDRALLLFMLATGCRLAETVAVNTGDINQAAGTVTLHQAKGGDPEQIITSEKVCGNLLHLANGTSAGQPLFKTSTNRRISKRQVQRIVARRIKEAGIEKTVTPHTLRHTYATRLYNATGDIRLVQKALRHQHVTTTETYAQVAPERLKEASESCIQFPVAPLVHA